ncbi:hypothetical protein [Rhodoferax sp.]|uniref:hypothetical protein n=1 Tax=Rhodoferax sp. TaxID=50421 RepID=UPI002621A86B|nr:hypothetical protein [Rhodoferax sp.]MDD5480935.1 hypothetical protein [Rhodoferax sp.]
MQIAIEFKPELCPKSLECFSAPHGQNHASRLAQEYAQNHLFVDLLNAYRRSGGLARAQEVAARFKRQGVNDISPLAGWLVRREVISIEWQSKIWLPLFQFQPAGMVLRPGLSAVLAELVVVYNAWEVATWFCEPNTWLADATPIDSLAMGTANLLDAARAVRFSQG